MSERYAAPGARRWTKERKRRLIEQVFAKPSTLAAVLREHGVSHDEFQQWVRLYTAGGVGALRTTRLQQYCDPPASAASRQLVEEKST